MAEKTDVKGVVEWFRKGNKSGYNSKGNKNSLDGFIISLADGMRTPLQEEAIDPALLGQLREDNIFLYDVELDPNGPNRKSRRAVNLRFDKTEPGATKKAQADFPKQGNQQKAKESADKKAADTSSDNEELWRLEVMGEPIDGDKSGKWAINVELDKNNFPVEGAQLKFTAGNQRFSEATGPTGWIEKEIEVATNTYGRIVYDSSISISAIAIAGPDPVAKAKEPLTKKQLLANVVFSIWTIIMVVSFGFCVHRTYTAITMPLAERQAQLRQGSSTADRPAYPWEKASPKKEVAQESTVTSIFSWAPWSSWRMFILGFIIWVLLIPICFAGLLKDAVVNVYLKAKGEIEAWQHSRKPFKYTVEVTRKGGKLADKPVYYYNGSRIEEPETKSDAWKSIKGLGWAGIKGSILKFELLAQIAGLIFDRVVLDRIFK